MVVAVNLCSPIEQFYTAFNIQIVPPIILEIVTSTFLASMLYYFGLRVTTSIVDYKDGPSD